MRAELCDLEDLAVFFLARILLGRPWEAGFVMQRLFLFVVCGLLFSACGVDRTDLGLFDDGEGSFRDGLTMSRVEEADVLIFLRDPRTTSSLLVEDVGLHSKVADVLLSYRAGPDGQYPTSDDGPLVALMELEELPFFGSKVLAALRDFVPSYRAASVGEVDGVNFNQWEASAVVWGINHSEVSMLDDGLGLDSRTAKNLVEHGPYTQIQAVGDVYYVGPTALEKLRLHAPEWAIQQSLVKSQTQAGIYHGVQYEEALAREALGVVNEESLVALFTTEIPVEVLRTLTAHRPYENLMQVAEQNGVDFATMEALRFYASQKMQNDVDEFKPVAP